VQESGAGASTLAHVNALEGAGRRFQDVDDLVKAVKQTQSEFVEQVYRYMLSPESTLFSRAPHIQITRANVRRMINEGTQGPATLYILQNFEDARHKHQTWESLIAAIAAEAQSRLDDQRDMRHIHLYLNATTTNLLGGALVTEYDVDKLYRVSNAGANTLPTLKQLEASGRTFHTQAELIAAIREKQIPTTAQKNAAFLLMKSPNMRVYSETKESVERQHLDEHWHAAFTAADMRALNAQGKKFDNVEKLSDALRKRYRILKMHTTTTTTTTTTTNKKKKRAAHPFGGASEAKGAQKPTGPISLKNLSNQQAKQAEKLLDTWISFGVRAKDLHNNRPNLLGHLNPYLEFYRSRGGGGGTNGKRTHGVTKIWEKVVRTNTEHKTRFPKFNNIVVQGKALCVNDDHRPLLVKCFDEQSKSLWAQPTLIGQFETTLAEMKAGGVKGAWFKLTNLADKRKFKNYVHSGMVQFSVIHVCFNTTLGVVNNEQSRLFPGSTDTFVRLNCMAVNLPSLSHRSASTGPPDTFLEFLELDEETRTWRRAYATELCEQSAKPQFDSFVLRVDELCKGFFNRPMLVKCWQTVGFGSHLLIGSFQTTLREILQRLNRRFKLNREMNDAETALAAVAKNDQANALDIEVKEDMQVLRRKGSVTRRASLRMRRQSVGRSQLVRLSLSATNLPSVPGKSGKADSSATNPYLQVYKLTRNMWDIADETEHKLGTTSPEWSPLLTSAATLCAGNDDDLILIKCFHWDKIQPPTFLGQCFLSWDNLLNIEGQSLPLGEATPLLESSAGAAAGDSKAPPLNTVQAKLQGLTNQKKMQLKGVLHFNKVELAAGLPSDIRREMKKRARANKFKSAGCVVFRAASVFTSAPDVIREADKAVKDPRSLLYNNSAFRFVGEARVAAYLDYLFHSRDLEDILMPTEDPAVRKARLKKSSSRQGTPATSPLKLASSRPGTATDGTLPLTEQPNQPMQSPRTQKNKAALVAAKTLVSFSMIGLDFKQVQPPQQQVSSSSADSQQHMCEIYRLQHGQWSWIVTTELAQHAASSSTTATTAAGVPPVRWERLTLPLEALVANPSDQTTWSKSPLLFRVWTWTAGAQQPQLFGEMFLNVTQLRISSGKRHKLTDHAKDATTLEHDPTALAYQLNSPGLVGIMLFEAVEVSEKADDDDTASSAATTSTATTDAKQQ
jgi:hypothetical protein